MPERKWLEPGDEIVLSRTKNDKNKTKFKIISVVGKGGSTVCYKVSCGGVEGSSESDLQKRGNLKEFYPEGIAGIERTKHNQLRLNNKEEQQRYQRASEDFLSAYQTLERVKKANTYNEVLNNYIPAYELYYGYENSEQPTVYIWTPDDQVGVGFDQYLAKVRENLEEYPVHKLYNILNTVITLADGICAIHGAGLLHLDIKPSNFLVTYNSQYQINPGNISLFDINTFYSVYCDVPNISGTVGYRAPEVEQGRADNRSDIYSLGAVLFQGVIISDEIEDNGLYKEEYYSQIDQLVFSSNMFKVSSVNDNIYLKSKIAKILKRCLAKRPSQRYECCEELIRDLKDTRIHLLTEKEKAGEGQRRFEWVEKGHLGKTCPTAIMQNLLFNQPLLDWVPKGVSSLNILVVGGGTYAQKFTDICLQLGQIAGFQLHMDVVSDEIDYDRNVYLQFRPALNQFVNVNDSLEGSPKEKYAHLNFGVESWSKVARKDTEFSKTNLELNQKNARKLMSKPKNEAYQYIFIALGDDTLNRHVADAFVEACNEVEHTCLVNYVVESNDEKMYTGEMNDDEKIYCDEMKSSKKHRDELYVRGIETKGNPVCVNAIIKPGTIHKDLERMAFNAYLLWRKPDKIDQEVVKEFNDTYHYESSLSFALSIRYKLLSLGIGDEDFETAAEKFTRIINDEVSTYHQLAAYEHRRWAIERLTQGWSVPLGTTGKVDFEKWVREGNYRAKGECGKLHLCIVRSSDEMPSLDEMWDREVSGMDVNVADVNQVEVSEAVGNVAEGNSAKGTEAKIEGIWDELDLVSVKLHQALKKYVEEIKESNPEVHQNPAIREKIEAIESNMYCNYKSYNEKLVKEIPGILIGELSSQINLHESQLDLHEWQNSESSKEYSTYTPKPIDTKGVVLPEELTQLTEKLSEHVHDIWARNRIEEGWRNGEQKDGEKLINPNLVPYSELSEAEKQYDRDTALETLKFIVKMGYRIERE